MLPLETTFIYDRAALMRNPVSERYDFTPYLSIYRDRICLRSINHTNEDGGATVNTCNAAPLRLAPNLKICDQSSYWGKHMLASYALATLHFGSRIREVILSHSTIIAKRDPL